jgi:hypothetical protein
LAWFHYPFGLPPWPFPPLLPSGFSHPNSEISYCIWKAPDFSVHLVFRSLMREYHDFRALPYTFPSD